MTGLYQDPETGKIISTHSMLKTFRRCPKQAEYKYARRLKPKRLGQPLKRGTWIHKLLEVHAKALMAEARPKAALEAMWEEHRRLSKDFDRLFDEEKEYYGDLPREIGQIMRAYFWHYAKHPWKVLDVEFVLEAELPDGALFRAKIDLLVEDEFGLWIVDHKSHKTLPKLDYRILDAQSADYLWAAAKNGIPVEGHLWNYVRWKMPTTPLVLQSGRISHKAIDTDYLTFKEGVEAAGVDPSSDAWVAAKLRYLKGLRYQGPGTVQASTFFRRDPLEKSKALISQVAREAYHTHRRMSAYPFDRPEIVERSIDRSCSYLCGYSDLCATELWGGNAKQLIKAKYKEEDPMNYYYDEKEMVDAGASD